ncbi:MAG: single-stranded DNA-binding protein [Bacilli bacterium]|nr:single-stranded DNA-binding protein [Bacilli bacterium]
MNNEKELRNSVNKFELEGNIGSVRDVYENQNGKKTLRFDIAQNNNGNTQFVPIVIKGELVNAYADEIEKGNWITVKGIITTYPKEIEKNGKTYKDKAIEILGFEIIDRTNNKIYLSDGQVKEVSNNKEEQER